MKITNPQWLTILAVFGCALPSFPQDINFGTRNEKQLDSSSAVVTNIQTVPVTYRIKFPFDFYASNPFRTNDSVFTLQPNESKTVKIYCKISHNILHNAEWILTSDHWSGDAAADIRCQGTYTRTYYSATQNQSEDALKASLKTILGNSTTSFSYDVARDHMYAEVDNHNDSVTCIYTGRKAKFNTRGGAGTNNFNCEHTFPQSLFTQNLPMRSDLHHLFSTDDNANSSRGNLPFGIATPPYLQPTWNSPSLNGGGRYEPQDSHKGNCARSMMYFVVRYQDYGNFFAPQQATLRQWHKQFPPQTKDSLRNQMVFGLQNNRNPFIDYPQFADRITNLVELNSVLASADLKASRTFIEYGLVTDPAVIQTHLAIWNQGTLDGQITGAQFVNNVFEWVSAPANPEVIAGGNSKDLTFRLKTTITGNIIDTLKLTTNNPQNPVIAIPLTALFTSAKNRIVQEHIRLSPNPTRAGIQIQGFTNLSSDEIRVSDALGRSVSVPFYQNQVDVSGLSSGIYHIRVLSNNRSASGQFIKE